jgi:hypothetical protein
VRELIGAVAATLFGLGLLIVGGRLIVYQHLLTTEGEAALAQITEVQTVRRSSGGYVNAVHYRFTDRDGITRIGWASGYSGQPGDTIRVEYSRRFPAVHRVSGQGGGLGYGWRWALLAVGAVFLFGGGRWLWRLRA